jgi:hypothetical protein
VAFWRTLSFHPPRLGRTLPGPSHCKLCVPGLRIEGEDVGASQGSSRKEGRPTTLKTEETVYKYKVEGEYYTGSDLRVEWGAWGLAVRQSRRHRWQCGRRMGTHITRGSLSRKLRPLTVALVLARMLWVKLGFITEAEDQRIDWREILGLPRDGIDFWLSTKKRGDPST